MSKAASRREAGLRRGLSFLRNKSTYITAGDHGSRWQAHSGDSWELPPSTTSSSHPSESTGNGMWLWSFKDSPPWYTSCSKVPILKPVYTVSPTGDQVFKHPGLWGTPYSHHHNWVLAYLGSAEFTVGFRIIVLISGVPVSRVYLELFTLWGCLLWSLKEMIYVKILQREVLGRYIVTLWASGIPCSSLLSHRFYLNCVVFCSIPQIAWRDSCSRQVTAAQG